ncbi:DUF2063 domain-containing protein [Pigmentiphaga aceris]|uniref:DUF2063 domain-containing protein n=1 Tax=Pigmentiphaga aceris TaxID=1940612 RepID=A0A5C0AXQ5_9BURK|nr:DNA-binding domain-containing protein [Pigmentiphaga aceris]QEI06213.1 DUF2063 domain-containing protein [Pigmentiphaga aceris]
MNTDTSSLGEFQSAFAAALFADDCSFDPIAALTRQPAFAIYRNTVRKACIDALEANYPAVARLVGEEWFRAVASIYAVSTPPRDARLMHYGADFADFLANFEPAASLTYLPDVARLDRLWTEAHVAAGTTVLDGSALASLPPESLGAMVLAPHPAARWAWFDNEPIHTIWHRNRADEHDTADIAWHGEGSLLTRPQDSVCWFELDRGDVAFLNACEAGQTLADAASASLQAQPDVDLSTLLAKLLRAGAFAGIH